jgi:starvation-inducible DNA-binding protein
MSGQIGVAFGESSLRYSDSKQAKEDLMDLAKKQGNLHHTKNTLSENVRAQSVEKLNKHLSAAIDLHAQIKQAHWNVRGPNFIAIHELFDAVATEVLGYTDELAERAAALGGTAHGTVQVAAKNSFLAPYPWGLADETAHIDAVSTALAAFGESARIAIDETAGFGDADTADLFTGISRGIDQLLWKVEAHRKV